jgi:membrane protein YqaA with SNARE-associated domain
MITQHVSERTKRLLQSRFGLWFVGVISFIESSLLVPIITDPFMVVYILANRNRWMKAVIVTVVTSVAGGVAAYGMAFFFSSWVLGFLSPYSLEQFTDIAARFKEETFVLTILGAITPIPYTLVGLAAGFVKGNLLVFIVASVLGRIIRYTIVGYLTYALGVQALEHIKRNLLWASVVTLTLVVVYLLVK